MTRHSFYGKILQHVGPLYRCIIVTFIILLCKCHGLQDHRNNHEGILDTGSSFWISAKQMVRRIKCMREGEREREREREEGQKEEGEGMTRWK